MTVHDADMRPAAAPLVTAEPMEAGGLLTIDLAAVESNWKRLASLTVPVECAAVVKADGYGCGLEPVTRILYRAGCRTFFVADVAEGRRVRAVAPEAAIYVLNGVMPGSAQAGYPKAILPISLPKHCRFGEDAAKSECSELAPRQSFGTSERTEPRMRLRKLYLTSQRIGIIGGPEAYGRSS